MFWRERFQCALLSRYYRSLGGGKLIVEHRGSFAVLFREKERDRT
jgi:hypothetical protein